MRIGYRATAVLAAAALLGMTAAAGAAGNTTAPGQNKLQCFDGTTDGGFGGTCTLLSNGAKGKATLDNTDSNPNGDYSGVYTINSTIYGAPLSSLTKLGYKYSGNIAPQPGNLSYNIPIDKDGNGTTDSYLFVDAFYCPGGPSGVDIVNDPACVVYDNGVTPYPSWAAFVATFPGAKVATDNFAFIIAERTPSEPSASWTVGDVTFGKTGK